MKGKEEKLVRKAAKAMAKLAAYRDRHAPFAAEGAASDIERTVRIAGWPREAADLLQRAGVSAQEAARLFSDALERPQ
jgi:hypothetical protein